MVKLLMIKNVRVLSLLTKQSHARKICALMGAEEILKIARAPNRKLLTEQSFARRICALMGAAEIQKIARVLKRM